MQKPAQSQLQPIHGGRDDITKFYSKYSDIDAAQRADAEAKAIEGLFDTRRRFKIDASPDQPTRRGSIERLLGDLLDRLSRLGFGSVFRHRFRADLNGLHVVKVIVPRCENIETDPRRMGPRLLARVL